MAKEIIRNWSRHYFKRVWYAILIFLIVLVSGIVGFMLIEGYSFINALFMTVITISTVGYGEVEPLSQQGKLFSIALIIFNIGVFAYAVSVITSFIIDGDFKELIKLRKMNKGIQQLNNHVIVCGFGRLGKALCKDLHEARKPFLVVEQDHDKISNLKTKGYLYYEGDATKDKTITSLGIERAETLVTTIPSDPDNVFIVLSAKEINKNINIISRASYETNISKLKLAGANHIIMPEHISGAYIAAMVNGDEKIDVGNWAF